MSRVDHRRDRERLVQISLGLVESRLLETVRTQRQPRTARCVNITRRPSSQLTTVVCRTRAANIPVELRSVPRLHSMSNFKPPTLTLRVLASPGLASSRRRPPASRTLPLPKLKLSLSASSLINMSRVERSPVRREISAANSNPASSPRITWLDTVRVGHDVQSGWHRIRQEESTLSKQPPYIAGPGALAAQYWLLHQEGHEVASHLCVPFLNASGEPSRMPLDLFYIRHPMHDLDQDQISNAKARITTLFATSRNFDDEPVQYRLVLHTHLPSEGVETHSPFEKHVLEGLEAGPCVVWVLRPAANLFFSALHLARCVTLDRMLPPSVDVHRMCFTIKGYHEEYLHVHVDPPDSVAHLERVQAEMSSTMWDRAAVFLSHLGRADYNRVVDTLHGVTNLPEICASAARWERPHGDNALLAQLTRQYERAYEWLLERWLERPFDPAVEHYPSVSLAKRTYSPFLPQPRWNFGHQQGF